jgi:hypothetical protein
MVLLIAAGKPFAGEVHQHICIKSLRQKQRIDVWFCHLPLLFVGGCARRCFINNIRKERHAQICFALRVRSVSEVTPGFMPSSVQARGERRERAWDSGRATAIFSWMELTTGKHIHQLRTFYDLHPSLVQTLDPIATSCSHEAEMS